MGFEIVPFSDWNCAMHTRHNNTTNNMRRKQNSSKKIAGDECSADQMGLRVSVDDKWHKMIGEAFLLSRRPRTVHWLSKKSPENCIIIVIIARSNDRHFNTNNVTGWCLRHTKLQLKPTSLLCNLHRNCQFTMICQNTSSSASATSHYHQWRVYNFTISLPSHHLSLQSMPPKSS